MPEQASGKPKAEGLADPVSLADSDAGAVRVASGEQMKAALVELCRPIQAYMMEHGISSFSIPVDETMDASFFRVPIPPTIKCVLTRFGCIYVIDKPTAPATEQASPDQGAANLKSGGGAAVPGDER